jgi:hypothetical protein
MSSFKSEFSGPVGTLVVTSADYVDGLTFEIEGAEEAPEVHLGKVELLRLHAALGTYIFREGLAL